MSTRLQIVMSDAEAASLRQAARRAGLTVSEWARRTLRAARDAQAGPSPGSRLDALDRALTCNHPTGDIDEMLAEIERGRDLRLTPTCRCTWWARRIRTGTGSRTI